MKYKSLLLSTIICFPPLLSLLIAHLRVQFKAPQEQATVAPLLIPPQPQHATRNTILTQAEQLADLRRSNSGAFRSLRQTTWHNTANRGVVSREALDPVSVVELSVVGLDLAVVGGQSHEVDTSNVSVG